MVSIRVRGRHLVFLISAFHSSNSDYGYKKRNDWPKGPHIEQTILRDWHKPRQQQQQHQQQQRQQRWNENQCVRPGFQDIYDVHVQRRRKRRPNNDRRQGNPGSQQQQPLSKRKYECEWQASLLPCHREGRWSQRLANAESAPSREGQTATFAAGWSESWDSVMESYLVNGKLRFSLVPQQMTATFFSRRWNSGRPLRTTPGMIECLQEHCSFQIRFGVVPLVSRTHSFLQHFHELNSVTGARIHCLAGSWKIIQLFSGTGSCL